ncbi:tetratricopeptide repeat protein [Streptomyces sp. 4F14]|uniref:tetratricopeptide repeat protein n=1 Tax=Streptomyces sp. 4F14 TaxID=3394380 RepID=UPI003A882629
MESALQALLSALTDGAAGPVGQDLARTLAEFLKLGERGGVPQSLRDQLGQLLGNSPDTARALGAAMEKLRPGSAALVGGDHIDFDGLFLGDVTGAVLHQHFHPAPAAAEPDPIAFGSLPPATPSFTGRKRLLQRLDDFLRPAPPEPGTATAAVLAGMAGVGKTALATEAAHAAKDKGWFPGGSLFIDLHGHDHTTVTAEQALGTLLEDLGTPAERLTTEEERVKHYRSQLDRWPDRVLIFADNAASAAQVRPLLPPDSRHRILITSRTAIPQLGAQQLLLGQLSPKVAVALLDQALRLANGADLRITTEAEAATELARLCGYLPLALQIAAAQLVWDPNKPVAEAVGELRDQRTLLAFLDDGERSVRTAFDLSYQRLTAEQACLLRLLAEAPGPETGADILAVLLGGAPRPGVLAALERAYLVDRSSSRTEWRLHDLVRVFATQVSGDDPVCAAERGDARERVLRHYLGRADEADNQLRGIDAAPGRFADPDEALGWFDKERLGLLAAVEWGAADRYTARALDLALCLTEYLRRRGLSEEVLTVNRLAREFAVRLGDRLREATAWQNAGDTLASSQPDEAIEAFGRAGELHRARGDEVGEAVQWNNRAIVEALRGELDAAIEAFGRARALRRTAGDRHGEAIAWNNLAVVLRESGREAEAFGAFTEAGRLLEDLGDLERASETYQNLGKALAAVGRDEEAAEAFARGRAVVGG